MSVKQNKKREGHDGKTGYHQFHNPQIYLRSRKTRDERQFLRPLNISMEIGVKKKHGKTMTTGFSFLELIRLHLMQLGKKSIRTPKNVK